MPSGYAAKVADSAAAQGYADLKYAGKVVVNGVVMGIMWIINKIDEGGSFDQFGDDECNPNVQLGNIINFVNQTGGNGPAAAFQAGLKGIEVCGDTYYIRCPYFTYFNGWDPDTGQPRCDKKPGFFGDIFPILPPPDPNAPDKPAPLPSRNRRRRKPPRPPRPPAKPRIPKVRKIKRKKIPKRQPPPSCPEGTVRVRLTDGTWKCVDNWKLKDRLRRRKRSPRGRPRVGLGGQRIGGGLSHRGYPIPTGRGGGIPAIPLPPSPDVLIIPPTLPPTPPPPPYVPQPPIVDVSPIPTTPLPPQDVPFPTTYPAPGVCPSGWELLGYNVNGEPICAPLPDTFGGDLKQQPPSRQDYITNGHTPNPFRIVNTGSISTDSTQNQGSQGSVVYGGGITSLANLQQLGLGD